MTSVSSVNQTKKIRKLPFKIMEGLKMPPSFIRDNIKTAISYKPKPGDIFLVSYPKCGTTWVQYIIYLMYNNGENAVDARSLFTSIPFIERDGFPNQYFQQDENDNMNGKFFAFKYHLPHSLVPNSPEAKYIYIARNPMDTFISYYHFFSALKYISQDLKFDDFFEGFLSGDCPYDDYFDHLVSWYNHHDDPNVLFLTYESLKKDTRDAILKIAKFLEQDVTSSNEKLLNDILKFSSLSYMKETLGSSLNDYVKGGPLSELQSPELSGERNGDKETEKSKVELVRKGKVGSWKEHMSEEQQKRMISHFMEKTKGTKLHLLWPEIFEASAAL